MTTVSAPFPKARRLAQLDVVVPSAHPLSVLRVTLPALATAATRPAARVASVTVVDDAGPRPELMQLAQGLGLDYVEGPARGPGPARNVGAARGASEVIAFVDDDVELDEHALEEVWPPLKGPGIVGVIGGLRPPDGSPDWLVWAYEDGVVTPASALAPPRELALSSFATGLCAVRRDAFESAGGFADIRGIEDAVFGLALQRTSPHGRLLRRPTIGGVHHYVPSWEEWLRRNEATGGVLATTVGTLDQTDMATLLANHSLDGTWRGEVKRLAGLLPPWLLPFARGRILRKLAASSAEARGFRRGRRAGANRRFASS